jgi:ABC-2 type transport system ATP-binding protein
MLSSSAVARASSPPDQPPAGDGAAVTTSGLTKSYGDRRVVDGVDLRVPRGALCGFVGPNGAGKTTTLRMLLGLIRPTSGEASVLGEQVTHPARYLHRVGAMIEGPTFHPGLSGRRNLDVLARLRRVGRARVAAVLATVGLADRADDPFRCYSLGMKQRLGIAAALLPDPELLILDEPTNGLDPAGIREIRGLLASLAGGGKTILVSSHLLAEVEQICDHIVMIRSGQVLFEGAVADLLAGQDNRIVLSPEDPCDTGPLLELVARQGLTGTVTGATVVVHGPEELAPALNRAAMTEGITLCGLTAHRPTLEEAFLAATGTFDGDLARHLDDVPGQVSR